MINLLQETLNILANHDIAESEVLWVGTPSAKITWDNFKAIANFEYDNGYGGEEINTNLFVVGYDWWLERHEYDGSEWWEFKQLPVEPEFGKVNLKYSYWDD